MTGYTLSAERRIVFGKKLKRERKQGRVPAILYGHGIANLPLLVEERAFSRILGKAGKNTIITLEISDPSKETKETRNVLIHEVDYDVLADTPVHADLYQIRMDEKVRVEVPVAFRGEAPAIKNSGGVLVRAMQSLAVEALPGELPREILVDISGLVNFGDTIYVKDLSLPHGVMILVDPATPIVSVAAPRSEEELKALEEAVVEKVEEVKVETEEKRAEKEKEGTEEGKPATE